MSFLKEHPEWIISSFVKNSNFKFKKKKILSILPQALIDDAVKSISSWKNYKTTPLLKLNKLRKKLSLKEIYYKDESKRFHLKSFKALGGAYAVKKISGKNKITVSTATAGNHGKSVAWGAKRLGIKCVIFVSEHVSEYRAKSIRKLGAKVIRVKGDYNSSLKECIKQSKKNNWKIVQDVSWKNYEYIPKLIMAGYCIMIKEIFIQNKKKSFSHVFLQAGVGGMAAAVIAGFARYFKKIPKIIIVEPDKAESVLKSIRNNKSVKFKISQESIMGGMSCGEVSQVPWKILKSSVNFCVSISDYMVKSVIFSMAKKDFSDVKIEGGECATPGIIALKSICFNKDIKKKIGINKNSKILLFGCEGATDTKMYNKIMKKK